MLDVEDQNLSLGDKRWLCVISFQFKLVCFLHDIRQIMTKRTIEYISKDGNIMVQQTNTYMITGDDNWKGPRYRIPLLSISSSPVDIKTRHTVYILRINSAAWFWFCCLLYVACRSCLFFFQRRIAVQVCQRFLLVLWQLSTMCLRDVLSNRVTKLQCHLGLVRCCCHLLVLWSNELVFNSLLRRMLNTKIATPWKIGKQAGLLIWSSDKWRISGRTDATQGPIDWQR